MSVNLFTLTLKSTRSFHLNSVYKSTQSLSRCFSTTDSNLNSNSASTSRTAFQQREILDQLRSSANSKSSSVQTKVADPNANANETLRALSSGGLSSSMLGDTSMRMNSGRRKGFTSRITAEGRNWKEIGAGQKVARATLFSSRTILVIAGATFTFIIVYGLASELFSPNSPTVVYGEACKLVKNSEAVASHLLPPYRFHTSISSISSTQLPGITNLPSRNGGRHQQVSSRMTFDSSGKEIMLLRFFLESRDKDRDLSILEKSRYFIVENSSWIWERVKDWSYELRENWRENLADGDDELRKKLDLVKAFRLGGGGDQDSNHNGNGNGNEEEGNGSSSNWIGKFFNSTFGSFSGLARSSMDSINKVTKAQLQPGTFSSGEVHGELIKDENGILQWNKLFIDVPSSSSSIRSRIWVTKKGEIQR